MNGKTSIAPASRPPVVVSRCDRLGDLVLSLPVLGYLRDAGLESVLHCGRYAADVGAWALHNGLCAQLWLEGEAPPAVVTSSGGAAAGLALFHSPLTVRAFRAAGLRRTLGPRPKLSAMWSYSKSVPQHRSRAEKSEMRYNVDLARTFLEWLPRVQSEFAELAPVTFRGLPALEVPTEWKPEHPSPDLAIVVSNNGSAANWPLDRYESWAESALSEGKSVSFLVSGLDAEARLRALEAGQAVRRGARVVTSFRRVGELIAWLAASGEVLSSSTGPLHLAHAAGVPVVGVYPDRPSQQTFARWRPDGYWHAAPVRYRTFTPLAGGVNAYFK